MTISDGLMILAVLIGPIIAIRLTRFLDERKELRERKLWVFKTLMATRAYTVSPLHVEALNRIDLEFDKNKPKEKAVVEKWSEYLDLLGDRSLSVEQWTVRRVELLVDLLNLMGQTLGYDFDRTTIKNATYSPTVHGKVEEQQDRMREGLLDLIEGKRALPMYVRQPPPTTGQQRAPGETAEPNRPRAVPTPPPTSSP